MKVNSTVRPAASQVPGLAACLESLERLPTLWCVALSPQPPTARRLAAAELAPAAYAAPAALAALLVVAESRPLRPRGDTAMGAREAQGSCGGCGLCPACGLVLSLPAHPCSATVTQQAVALAWHLLAGRRGVAFLDVSGHPYAGPQAGGAEGAAQLLRDAGSQLPEAGELQHLEGSLAAAALRCGGGGGLRHLLACGPAALSAAGLARLGLRVRRGRAGGLRLMG
jgi:hypothetical protein